MLLLKSGLRFFVSASEVPFFGTWKWALLPNFKSTRTILPSPIAQCTSTNHIKRQLTPQSQWSPLLYYFTGFGFWNQPRWWMEYLGKDILPSAYLVSYPFCLHRPQTNFRKGTTVSPSLSITYAVWSGQPLRGESGKQIGGNIFCTTSPNWHPGLVRWS